VRAVAVLYATREGQTRRIAEHVAATLRAQGLLAEVQDVKHMPPGFALGAHSAAIVAASVHMGRHEREMVAFVKEHREELEALPTAFLSVSLTEASVEDGARSADARVQASKSLSPSAKLA